MPREGVVEKKKRRRQRVALLLQSVTQSVQNRGMVVLKPLCGECPVSSSTLPYVFYLLSGAQSVAEIQGGIKHLLTMAIIL